MRAAANRASVVRTMFVDTADRNYVLARLAHFHRLGLDFYWLSLHALEKYFKAILLLNGHSTQKFSHDLIQLHDAVTSLHDELRFGPFADPQIEGLPWREVSLEAFLRRLNTYGNPNNRYVAYGYSVVTEDLVRVDQLIWSVRRFARPLSYSRKYKNVDVPVDEVRRLNRNRKEWELHGAMAIRQVLDGHHGKYVRDSFRYLNKPFAPDINHRLRGWRVESAEAPLVYYFDALRRADASHTTRAAAADLLRWAADNIRFAKKDQATIVAALASYEQS